MIVTRRAFGVPKNSSAEMVSRALFIDCRVLCPFHVYYIRTKHQFNTFPIELFYDGAAATAADVLTTIYSENNILNAREYNTLVWNII